jgi:hypothetical protein
VDALLQLQVAVDLYTIGTDGSGLAPLTNDGLSSEGAWGP